MVLARLMKIEKEHDEYHGQVLEVGLEGARRFAPAIHGDCQTVAERATELGAIAGMNGGFFGMSDCASLDFVKAGGTVLSVNRLNGLPQRAVGWSSDGGIQHTWVEETDTWPEVSEGISGYPSLVTSGTAAAEARPGEQVYSSIDWSQHPRSALGITADDRLLLVTVAGRTTAGAGLTTPRLADSAAHAHAPARPHGPAAAVLQALRQRPSSDS